MPTHLRDTWSFFNSTKLFWSNSVSSISSKPSINNDVYVVFCDKLFSLIALMQRLCTVNSRIAETLRYYKYSTFTEKTMKSSIYNKHPHVFASRYYGDPAIADTIAVAAITRVDCSTKSVSKYLLIQSQQTLSNT